MRDVISPVQTPSKYAGLGTIDVGGSITGPDSTTLIVIASNLSADYFSTYTDGSLRSRCALVVWGKLGAGWYLLNPESLPPRAGAEFTWEVSFATGYNSLNRYSQYEVQLVDIRGFLLSVTQSPFDPKELHGVISVDYYDVSLR